MSKGFMRLKNGEQIYDKRCVPLRIEISGYMLSPLPSALGSLCSTQALPPPKTRFHATQPLALVTNAVNNCSYTT